MSNEHRRRRRFTVFYPTTAMYLTGVVVACGISADLFSRDVGLVVLTVMASLLILVALTREVRTVHTLVNSHRDELLERIDQLLNTLHSAGVEVPDDPALKETRT